MNEEKKIIAHRGIPVLSHENTLDSFAEAIGLGADLIEFDIRRTADGELIAFHDPSIAYQHSKFLLEKLTFAEAQAIANHQGFKIPTIKEIFERFCGKVGFDIEFKEENCEEETINILTQYQCKKDCIITSFNEAIIRKVQSLWPQIPAGLLIHDQKTIEKCILTDYKMLCPSKEIFRKNRKFFINWKKAGRYIAVWTVDDTSEIKQLLGDAVVSSIITNRCHIALELRKQSRQIS